MSNRQIILDTETTGLYANNDDRLVEFAGLEMVNRQFTANNLHLYVHPERDMPEEAAAVHGLTIEVLEEKNAPVFAEVGRRIADFLCGAELIIHNAKFDVGFLNMEFTRMGLPTVEELGCTVTDTLAMAKEMFPGQKASLDALCTRFEIDRSKRVFHGALIDCELLGEVYLAMTRGQFSLVDNLQDEVSAGEEAQKTQRPEYLKVLCADEGELALHEAYLDALDKASDGQCAWRMGMQGESV
ncbi:DNA polymerase III subunit epsilon [Neisseria weaveri]|uniref:DNA polymerase III subunit epsilon n=1 Tax=Neisseria weaveri TaxID=28091 RepID=UPI000D30ED05|nr:DNA polymerase III subunit epsilon [Neisseria weaveri]